MAALSFMAKALVVLRALDGATREEVRERTGIPVATLTRYLSLLRKLGVVVRSVKAHPFYIYKVEDYGPFDPSKLRRAINARG